MNPKRKNILLAGDSNLTFSIAVNFITAGFRVKLVTGNSKEALKVIGTHFSDIRENHGTEIQYSEHLEVVNDIGSQSDCSLAVLVTHEKLKTKSELLILVERKVSQDCIIAINSESIGLDELQTGLHHPDRVIGLNWTEPSHTTRFLEIITNRAVKADYLEAIKHVAVLLKKDPYVVKNYGIRSRLLCSMIREAFYLVENGYATIDDIDRACRNDPGYYLPFAGNCRYMDLMGTYAYGMVMKDLNPDLSKARSLPSFFTNLINEGGVGMENREGFYHYRQEDQKFWQRIAREFSYRIEEIIDRYPFNYKETG